MKRIGIKLAVVVYALSLLASCGNTEDSLESAMLSASLSSIDVTPSSSSVNVGSTRQFTATGLYSDTTKANLTNSATWRSSNTSLVTIDNKGLATVVASGGPVEITATSSGKTGKAYLSIID